MCQQGVYTGLTGDSKQKVDCALSTYHQPPNFDLVKALRIEI